MRFQMMFWACVAAAVALTPPRKVSVPPPSSADSAGVRLNKCLVERCVLLNKLVDKLYIAQPIFSGAQSVVPHWIREPVYKPATERQRDAEKAHARAPRRAGVERRRRRRRRRLSLLDFVCLRERKKVSLSRRAADAAIAGGRVSVDGAVRTDAGFRCVAGQSVRLDGAVQKWAVIEEAKTRAPGARLKAADGFEFIYIKYWKPKGVTRDSPEFGGCL